eukprot:scaffold18643_cov234-Skeletonema_dohrnii-CCMP3373.AAC.1
MRQRGHLDRPEGPWRQEGRLLMVDRHSRVIDRLGDGSIRVCRRFRWPPIEGRELVAESSFDHRRCCWLLLVVCWSSWAEESSSTTGYDDAAAPPAVLCHQSPNCVIVSSSSVSLPQNIAPKH